MNNENENKDNNNNINNKKGRIHYGSLEEVEKTNQKRSHIELEEKNLVDIDKIVTDNSYQLESATRSSLEHQQLLEEFEKSKRAKSLLVPTDDLKVRQKLRELKEPITLFGERPGDRRARLRILLTGEDIKLDLEGKSVSSEDEEEEEFYTEGPMALKTCRQIIGHYSLPKAHERLKFQAEEMKRPIAHSKALRQDLYKYLKTYGNYSSQVGDERPLTQVKFSPNSKLLATGSWSGLCKLWEVPNCNNVLTLRGHTDRIGGIAFHPESTKSLSKSVLNLASGSADKTICLWNLENDTPLSILEGHEARVSRIAFHPMGNYLASASFDTTWRLWDLTTQQELLMQEGHSREVYGIAFQPDGSLIATGGLDAIGRVWDLRTGKSIVELKGHVREILGIDFSPNGHEIATSSEDNSIKIWDLRTLKTLYTIPAHKSIVSDLHYYKGEEIGLQKFVDPDSKKMNEISMKLQGLYLVSSSYDGTVKFWSSEDYRLVHSLNAHEGKVMAVDVANDNKWVVTAGYDRTFKLWTSDSIPV